MKLRIRFRWIQAAADEHGGVVQIYRAVVTLIGGVVVDDRQVPIRGTSPQQW